MLLDQEDFLELGLLKVCKTNQEKLKYLQMREGRLLEDEGSYTN